MKVILSPQEFRNTLSADMQKLFDSLVSKMVELGQDEDSSRALIAKTLFDSLQRMSTEASRANTSIDDLAVMAQGFT